MIKDESVLSRWSRRKLQSDRQTLKEDINIELQQHDGSIDLPELNSDELSDNLDDSVETQEVLTDADMPDIESLHEGSDFSGFMSPGVSDKLRNLALRKLFQAPSFNIRDGLDEYDEDYTSFEKLGDIITCDMKHQLEMEAEKKLQEAELLSSAEETDGEAVEDSVDLETQQELASIEQQASDAEIDDLNNIDEKTQISAGSSTNKPTQEPT